MWKIVLPVLAVVFSVGSVVLTGGFSTISSNDDGALNALKFAVGKHNKETNDMYLRQVTDVIKVERQVVSGYKYKITVKMARTTCRRDSANEVCAVHTDPALALNYTCTFTVWTQPWNGYITLLDQKC